MIRGRFAYLLLAFALSMPLAAFAQSDAGPSADIDEYILLISKLKTLPMDRQSDELKNYLDKHPDTGFRSEIENNISSLNKFMANTDPTKKKDEKDTDLYLKAVSLAKKLSYVDQVALWEQFLSENPDSIYKKDVLYKLQNLKSKSPTSFQDSAPQNTTPIQNNIPISRNLAYKDKDKALLLSIFPGLVVPGIAHWYTKDYMIAGILTALRIGGLGIGLSGLLQYQNTPTLIGGIVTGFSYVADVADAPFTVDRYNEKLEQRTPPLSFAITPKSVLVSYKF